MARFSLEPGLMQLDDGATGAPRMYGPKTDTSQVSEADINAAVAQAGEDLEVDKVTLAYEAGNTGATVKLNKFSPEELKAYQRGRTDKATQTRKFGTEDNPQPYDAPSGANWNLYGGVWKLYYKGAYIGDENGFDQSIIDSINTKKTTTIVNNGSGGNGNGGNTGKTILSRKTNDDGSVTITYSDGTFETISAVIPGSGAGAVDSSPTLASNVFKNTLALFFGAEEMTKPWVDQLYKSVSGFYKTGSTVAEAFNMAVLESEKNPAMIDFTKRFKGIYALQKMKQAGKAVTVPTIAEYFATESKMGDMLKASNLGEIANEDFLGDVLGKGVSATEFGNRITQIFDRIDNAPQAIKTTLNRFFPYLDRISLAKALALGDKGATMLQQEVAGYEVLAAGEFQGLGLSAENPMGLTVARASDIAKSGGTYASTLGQFGQIKKAMPIVSSLEQISNKTDRLGQVGLEKALIGKSAKELTVLEQLTAEEEARYLERSGSIGPRGLASQARGSGGSF